MVIGPRRVTTAPASLAALDGVASNEYIKSCLVSPNGFAGIDFSNKPLGTSIICSMSTPRIKGLPASLFPAAEDMASAVTTVPVDQWYWLISAINLDGSTSASFKFIVAIEYDVEFFGKVEDNLDLTAKLQRLGELVDAKSARSFRRAMPVTDDDGKAGSLPASRTRTATPVDESKWSIIGNLVGRPALVRERETLLTGRN
jgi:hypothetical protein